MINIKLKSDGKLITSKEKVPMPNRMSEGV